MKNTILRASLLGLVLAVSSSSGHAGECGYEKCWGAVAFGHKGRISYSFGKWSERAAHREATKSCRWMCSEVHTFYNECAAVARGADQKWAISTARTRDLAKDKAKKACSATSYECRVIVWACSR
ncbi:DUF4189 domain-containing protein [Cognatishimia coralii]|uniref:DUF4189 domain-containing protein n=1 Tax=Cognatishimia coralii TaxID=3083254 RepID=UPI0034DB26B4